MPSLTLEKNIIKSLCEHISQNLDPLAPNIKPEFERLQKQYKSSHIGSTIQCCYTQYCTVERFKAATDTLQDTLQVALNQNISSKYPRNS